MRTKGQVDQGIRVKPDKTQALAEKGRSMNEVQLKRVDALRRLSLQTQTNPSFFVHSLLI